MVESYYTPERINTILRNWPRYQSQAEGCRSTAPDALRPAKGKRGDQLAGADVVADVEKALVSVLVQWGIEYTVVVSVMRGYSLTRIAGCYQIGKGRVVEAYDAGCVKMASYLGWVDDAPT